MLTHAVTLFAQGRPDLAKKVLLRLHSEPVAVEHRAVIKRAYVTIAFECGDTEAAARTFARYRDEIERAGSEDGGMLEGMPDVLEELAELTATGGETLSAGQYMDPFLVPTSLSPDTAHMGSARKHFADRDYDAALIEVTRAIELAPEDVEAYTFRAILRMITSRLRGVRRRSDYRYRAGTERRPSYFACEPPPDAASAKTSRLTPTSNRPTNSFRRRLEATAEVVLTVV